MTSNPYTPQPWNDGVAGGTPITAARLNYLESGIATVAGLVASAFQDVLGRIRTNIEDVNILIYSDSTAQMTGSWARLWPAALAAEFPDHSIAFHDWTDGSPGSWVAPVITAGTGPRTIHIWNGSVAGKTWEYHYDATRRETLIVSPNPDLILFSIGHNENYSLANVGNMQTGRDKAVAYIESVRTAVPTAAIVLTAQNPMTLSGRENVSQYQADLYRRIALDRGYGFIDACQAFIDDGRNLASVLVNADGIHPSGAGHTVWLNEVMTHFLGATQSQIIPKSRPSLFQSAKQLASTAAFKTFTAPNPPSGWTGTNVTASQNSTFFETGSYAIQFDKTSAASAYMQSSMQITLLRGQWVTFAVRMYIPSASPSSAGRVGILTSGGGATYSDIWSGTRDQWFWRTVTARIDPTRTSATLEISLDTAAGATSTIYVDRVTACFGMYPCDA